MLKRRVLIVGCGALGGVLVDVLGPCADVKVVDPHPRAKVKKHLLCTPQELHGQAFDGLMVATKCYDFKRALKALKGNIIVPRVLFLQNGILNLDEIKSYWPEVMIVRGVTESAVGIASQKAIFHYRGNFYLAPEDDQGHEAVGWFWRLLSDAGLKTSLVSKSASIIWAKLIFSSVMNPLPVITRQGYDILKRDKIIWGLVRQAVGEGRAVARALGVRLAFDPLRLIHRVRDGDLAGIAHRGSIFQDLSAGKPTELDFITGALIRQARLVGIKTPALDSILFRAKSAGA